MQTSSHGEPEPGLEVRGQVREVPEALTQSSGQQEGQVAPSLTQATDTRVCGGTAP